MSQVNGSHEGYVRRGDSFTRSVSEFTPLTTKICSNHRAPALDLLVVEHGARVRISGADLNGRALCFGDVDTIQVISGVVRRIALGGPHRVRNLAIASTRIVVVVLAAAFAC